MEEVLFKAGLCITDRALELMQHLAKRNFENRMKALIKTTGLAISYTDAGLDDDWQIIDAGGANIQIKAGVAIFDNYQAVEMSSDSDSIPITVGGTVYTVLIQRGDQEKEPGTVQVTAGSLAIVGTNTLFSDEFEVGEWLQFDGTNSNNEVPLIIASITDNTHLTVESIDGNGDAVSFTNESGMDIYSVGRFANGYPAGGDDNHLRNHDEISIIVTDSPGGYSHKIVLGTVANNAGVLTIVDQREDSLLELKNSFNFNNFTASENLSDSTAPDRYGGGTMWFWKVTNGTTVIKIDDTIDWRDRLITVQGYISPTDATPTGYLPNQPTMQDGSLTIDTDGNLDTAHNYVSGCMYTFDGHATGASHSMSFRNDTGAVGGDVIVLWVDDGTSFAAGNLVMKESGDANDENALLVRVDFSPKLNFY